MKPATRTVLAFEPVCHGAEHAQFNAGLLAALLTIAERAIFFAHPTHLDAVRELLHDDQCARIQWRTLDIPPRHSYGVRARLAGEWRTATTVWRAARSQEVAAIVAAGTSEAGLMVVKARAALSKRPMRVGVVFHSILAQLVSSARYRALLRFGNPEPLRYLVLGESLMHQVEVEVSGIEGTLRTFTHPYSFDLAPCTPSQLDAGPLTFGFLGLATSGKGFPRFLELAKTFSQVDARFKLVGHLDEESRALLAAQYASGPHDVVVPRANGRIPLATYRERLNQLNYAVFPYDAEAYKYVRSGAVLDAVWAGKPIVASRIPAFEEIFERIGDIGYLCADAAEMNNVVAGIIASPPRQRFALQSENLIRGRPLFESRAVGQELRRALSL